MITWALLLLAAASYITSAQSKEYQDSAPAPEVFRKAYTSGSQDHPTGGASSSGFSHPSNTGSSVEVHSRHHEDSKYNGPLNRPGVLHSRYRLVSPREVNVPKSPQLNTLPLQTQGRNQEHNNDRTGDSRYHGSSSDSDAHHNIHPSAYQDQMFSDSAPRATYVQVSHDGSRGETRDDERDRLKHHNSRSNPSVPNSFSSKSNDQSFEESAPRGTFVLPPYNGNHEQNLDGRQEELKYHDSKDFKSVDLNGVSLSFRDQSFDESGSHLTNDHLLPHVVNHDQNVERRSEDLKYHKSKDFPSVANNGVSSSFRHQTFDNSGIHASNEKLPPHIGDHDQPLMERQDDLKSHNSKDYSSVSNNGVSSSGIRAFIEQLPPHVGNHDQPLRERPEDLKSYNSKNYPSVANNGISSSFRDQSFDNGGIRASIEQLPPHIGNHDQPLRERPEDLKSHNSKDYSLVANDGVSSSFRDQSFDSSNIRAPNGHLPSYVGNHDQNLKGKSEDLKNYISKDFPLVANKGDSSRFHDQTFEKSGIRASNENLPPHVGKYDQNLQVRPEALKNHNYEDFPSVNNNGDSSSFRNQPSYKSGPQTTYDNLNGRPEDMKNQNFKDFPMVVHNGDSSKQSFDESAHRATYDHLLPHFGHHDQNVKESHEGLNHHNTNDYLSVAHSGVPSRLRDQSFSDRGPQAINDHSHDQNLNKRQEDLNNPNPKDFLAVAHNSVQSSLRDQSFGESGSRAINDQLLTQVGHYNLNLKGSQESLNYQNTKGFPSLAHNGDPSRLRDQSFGASRPVAINDHNHDKKLNERPEDLKYPNLKDFPAVAHDRDQSSLRDQAIGDSDSQAINDHFQSHIKQYDQNVKVRQADLSYHNSNDLPLVSHNGGSFNFRDQSIDETGPLATNGHLLPSVGHIDQSSKRRQDDSKNHNFKDLPLVAHNGVQSSSRDQSFGDSGSRVINDHLQLHVGHHDQSPKWRHEDLNYHKSKDSPSVAHNGVSLNVRDQQFDESVSHVANDYLQPHAGNHDQMLKERPEDSKNHNSKDLPSVAIKGNSSSFRDQFFDESGHRATYDHLLPHVGHHDQNHKGKHEDVKYLNSKDNPSVAHSVVLSSFGGQSFDECIPCSFSDYIPYDGNHDQNLHKSKEDLKYHNSKIFPSVDHNGFSSSFRDQPFDPSGSRASYDHLMDLGNHEQNLNGKQEDFKYHNSKEYPSVDNKRFSLGTRDQSFDEMYPRATHGHPHEDGKVKKGLDGEWEDIEHYSSKGFPSEVRSGVSSRFSDQSIDKSVPRTIHEHPPHKENHELNLAGEREDLKYYTSKGFPSVIHSGDSSSQRDQSFEENKSRNTDNDVHEENREGQQKNLKYQNPISNSNPLLNHNSFPLNTHDSPIDKNATEGDYETQKRDLKYHRISNHPTSFHKEILLNPQDKLSDRNPPREHFVHSSYGGNHEQVHDGHLGELNYHNLTSKPPVIFHSNHSSNHHNNTDDLSKFRDILPHLPMLEAHESHDKNNPSGLNNHHPASNHAVVFHDGYSSNSHVQLPDHNGPKNDLLHPLQSESQREAPDSNQEDLDLNDNERSSSDNHRNVLPSENDDQSTGESFIRTVIIKPSPKKKHRNTHNRPQEDLRYVTTFRTPSTSFHDRYPSNARVTPVQNTHRFITQSQQPFGDNFKTPHGFGYQSTTISPSKIRHNSYQESLNENIRATNDHQRNHGQLLYKENYKGNHNKPLEHLRHPGHNDSPPVTQSSFVGTHSSAQDHTRHHQGKNPTNKYVSEQNSLRSIQTPGFETHAPFHESKVSAQPEDEIKVNNYYNSQPIKNHPFPKHQQSELPINQHVAEHSKSSDPREHAGYETYNGPYTKPQNLHNGPKSHEVTYSTIESFGTTKAPLRQLQPSGYLNSQHYTGSLTPNSHQDSPYSLAENQLGGNLNDHTNTRNNGFPENRYSQSVPHALYDDSTRTTQDPRTRLNTNQTVHFLVTARPQAYAGSNRGDDFRAHHATESLKNRIPQVHEESPHQYSYSTPVPSLQHIQDTFNNNNPQNSTRNEQFGSAPVLQTNPTYHYGGEYVNNLGSNNNAFHTENQYESNTVPQDRYVRQNSTNSNNILSINNLQTHSSYPNGGSYNSDLRSSGLVGHSGPHQEQQLYQVPAPNAQTHEGYRSTNSDHFSTTIRPPSNGEYHGGNDHRYTSGQGENTKFPQVYTSQSNVPLKNHQDQQNAHSSYVPVVASNFADQLNPAGNVQETAGQQDGGVQSTSYASADHLYPGIQHDFTLKFPFNQPKSLTPVLNFLSSTNQSEHFAVTPATPIYAGYLDSRSQRPSGTVGYTDTQQGYAPQMPYQHLSVGKPMVLQSRYQEDTHEISHAKHDQLHVHHTKKSGYQYGIIS